MCAPVVLQVSSRGELLATVLLLADEGLLAVVSPHVNLQPLEHVEALSAALRAAPEHAVVPGWRGNKKFLKNTRLDVSCAFFLFLWQQPTEGSDRATANRFPAQMLRELLHTSSLKGSAGVSPVWLLLSASTTNNLWKTLV